MPATIASRPAKAAPKLSLTLEEMDFVIDTYLPRPHLFVQDVIGANTWPTQDEIVKSTFKNKLTAVKTCNAIGKSYIAARIVITYLFLYPGSIVVTTAPTWKQVTDVLWREVGTALKKSKYKLTTKDANKAGLSLDTDWYAVGLSTSRPENFFGYHADRILVVVDEAGGVNQDIFKGVAAITPNVNARILLIGNPTNPAGLFYECFTMPELGANCITVSAFDTPNFTATGIKNVDDLLRIYTPRNGYTQSAWTAAIDEALAKRMDKAYSPLISPSVVYGRYHEWGTDSPLWQALIMGEFPTQANNALIPLDLIQAAMNRSSKDKPELRDDMTEEERLQAMNWDSGWNVPEGPLQFGVDVARFGEDATVLAPRRGGFVDPLIVRNRLSTDKTVDLILDNIDKTAHDMTLRIDDTGVGGGVTDQLHRRLADNNHSGTNELWNYRTIGINFGSSAMDEDRFFNRRAEMFWHLREQFIQRKISLPLDLNLANELASIRYSFTPKDNKIKIESKDEIKKRLGKSPDLADAVALAFAPSGAGVFTVPEIQQRTKDERGDPDDDYQDARPETAGLASKRF